MSMMFWWFLVVWRFWLGYGEAFFAVTLGLFVHIRIIDLKCFFFCITFQGYGRLSDLVLSDQFPRIHTATARSPGYLRTYEAPGPWTSRVYCED